MYRGYKIRLYPTIKQKVLIQKHVGACRFMWNYMLDIQETRHKSNEKHLNYNQMCKHITEMKAKEEFSWLKEIAIGSLQKTCLALDDAYQRYFNRVSNQPKFKSKKKSSISFSVDDYCYFDGNYVHIPKLGKVKFRSDFSFTNKKPYMLSHIRLFIENGKYMLSFVKECENQVFQLSNESMGIDVGIKDLAIVAYGNEEIVFHNINKSKQIRELEKRLKHTQRSVSRKYEASKKKFGKYIKTKNIIKEEDKIRRLYRRIKNIRENYIHQTTNNLINMLPRNITMEDIDLSSLAKKKYIAKYMVKQNISELIRQVKYKSDWKGINFNVADRYFPSSKTCSNCGNIKKDLKLSDRIFICNKCGFKIDRDFNAAINLMRYKV